MLFQREIAGKARSHSLQEWQMPPQRVLFVQHGDDDADAFAGISH
jgi:hypothetical protein